MSSDRGGLAGRYQGARVRKKWSLAIVVAAVMVLSSIPFAVGSAIVDFTSADSIRLVDSVGPGNVGIDASYPNLEGTSTLSPMDLNLGSYFNREALDVNAQYNPYAVLFPNLPEIQELSLREQKELADRSLAYYWAPIWYQDVAFTPSPTLSTWGGWNQGHVMYRGGTDWKADLITRFDYDGNWKGNDNWDHLWDFENSLSAYIYYRVLETPTHWYIGYYDFHPRDWVAVEYEGIVQFVKEWFSNDQHENDMEGVMLTIEKTTGDAHGILVEAEFAAHGLFKSYDFDKPLIYRNGDDLPTLHTESYGENPYHPKVFIEASSHGCYARMGDRIWGTGDWLYGFPESNGVKYVPSGVPEIPTTNFNGTSGGAVYGYALQSIDVLWDKRFDCGYDDPFYEYGVFKGNDPQDGDFYLQDRCVAPWGLDDCPQKWWHIKADGPTFVGDWFYDPAHFVSVRSNIEHVGDFSRKYVYNPYAVRLDLESFVVYADRDLGDEDYTDPYFNIFMSDGKGDCEWDYNYLSWGLHTDTTVNPYDDGIMDKDSGVLVSKWWRDIPPNQRVFVDDSLNVLYGIRYPNYPMFGIRARDNDPGKVDDWLMSQHNTKWYGPSWGSSGWDIDDDGVRHYMDIKEDTKYTLTWAEAEAEVRFYGDVLDEDTDPPVFSNAIVNPSYLQIADNNYLHFSIDIFDTNGISQAGRDRVKFSYRDPSNTSWITREVTAFGEPISGKGMRAYFRMDPAEWLKYAGQTIQYKWKATDNDLDNPFDQMTGTWIGYGPRIESNPPIGYEPTLDGDTVAFVKSPQDDSITYIRNGVIHETGLVGSMPDVSGDIIAYTDYDYYRGKCVVRCLDVNKNTTTTLVPRSGLEIYEGLCISGGAIAQRARQFNTVTQQWELGIAWCYMGSGKWGFLNCGEIGSLDMDESLTVFSKFEGLVTDAWGTISVYSIAYIVGALIYEIAGVGDDPSIDDGVIAYTVSERAAQADLDNDGVTGDLFVRYFDTKTGAAAEIGKGLAPSVDYPLIAYTSREYTGSIEDPVMIHDMVTGQSISTSKTGKVYELCGDQLVAYEYEGWFGHHLNSDDDLTDGVIKCIPVPMKAEAYTPAGSNIEVSLYDLGSHTKVVLNFPLVLSPGNSSIAVPRSTNIPLSMACLPQIVRSVIVNTTAVYEGDVGVTIVYNPTAVVNEGRARMAQMTVDGWVDITTQVNAGNHSVRGTVQNLPSLIGVAELTTYALGPKFVGWGIEPVLSNDIIAYRGIEPKWSLETYSMVDETTFKTRTQADLVCAEDTRAILQVWIPVGRKGGYYLLKWVDNVTGESGYIGPGECPSVDSGIVAFHLPASTGANAEICYNILATNTTVHTGVLGMVPSINYPRIAFVTSELWVSQDLDGDGLQTHCVLRYLDIQTGEVVNTGVPFHWQLTIASYLVPYYCMGDSVIGFWISESLIQQDWNGDFDCQDNVMCYFDIETEHIIHLGVLGRNPAVSGNVIAFDCYESNIRKDLNHDGDTKDQVIVCYNADTGELTSTGLVGENPSIYGNAIAYSVNENHTKTDVNGDGDMNDIAVMYARLFEPSEMPSSSVGGGFSLMVPSGMSLRLANLRRTVSVSFDPASLEGSGTLDMKPIPPDQYDSFLTSNANDIVSDGVFELNLSGTSLTAPVEITMVYTESRVDETHPEQIVAYTSSIPGVWEEAPIINVDTIRNTVLVGTEHFSLYVLMRNSSRTPPPLYAGQNQSLMGHVYLDSGNAIVGEMDPGETGIGNWQVTLDGWTTSGQHVHLVTYTDNADDLGLYQFPDVRPGAYWLNQTMLFGFNATNPSSWILPIGIGLQTPTGPMVVDFGVVIPSACIEMPFVLEKGWNLWSAPMTPGNLTAKTLLALIGGNATELSRWDSIQGGYSTYSSADPEANNFPIVQGEGYFIFADSMTTFCLNGSIQVGPVIVLNAGYNLVAYSGAEGKLASDLLALVAGGGVVKTISYFDTTSGIYHTYATGFPPAFDFVITAGRGYYIWVDTSATLVCA